MEKGAKGNYFLNSRTRVSTAADESESWRSHRHPDGQDHSQSHSPKSKRGGNDWRFGMSPRRKAHLYSPGSSPEGYKFGHSPSQREGFRRFVTPDSHRKANEDNWRDSLQQSPKDRWRRDSPAKKEQKKESFKGRLGKKDATDFKTPSSGGKPRSEHRRRDSSRTVFIGNCVTVKDLHKLFQAEERIINDDFLHFKGRSDMERNIQFNCDECRVVCENFNAAVRHLREKSHKKKAKASRELNLLQNIPPPCKEQIIAIGSVLNAVASEVGLCDQDLEQRKKIVSLMEEVIKPVLPDSTLRLYGSSCTKFGFKDSDVNIDIQFPSHMHQPDVLLLVQGRLSSTDLFVNVEADFHTRVPAVVCKEKDSGLICKVTAGNDSACLTSAYLSELANQEPLLLLLVLCFRQWARICHVDQMDEGGLPPYCIALMVIAFFQQRKEPLLPSYLESANLPLSKLKGFSLTGVENGHVHWEYHPLTADGPNDAPVSGDKAVQKGRAPLVIQRGRVSVEPGQLWVEMLRFYSLEFHIPDKVISVRTNAPLWRDTKDWPKKRIAIEDPFSVKRNVARTVNSQLIFDYFMHCLKTTYKYFASPLDQLTAKNKPGTEPSPDDSPKPCQPTSLSDINYIQSEMEHLRVTPDETNRHSDRHASGEGEFKFNFKVDLLEDSDCVIEEEIEEEEEEEREVEDVEEEEEEEEESDSDAIEEEDDEDDEDEDIELDESKWDPLDDELFAFDGDLSERLPSDSESEEEDEEGSAEEEDGPPPVAASPEEPPNEPPKPGTPDEADKSADRFCYVFSRHVFTNGKRPAVVCSLCKQDGHSRKDCPEDFKKVDLDPLPPMTPQFLKTLNDVCEQCYRDFAPDDIEEQVREHILKDLEVFIRRQIQGARLKLFGSSKNGFGFKQSDLDICMILDGKDTAEGLDCIGIIKNLAKALRKHPGLKNILPITTAKVPIVKFYHVKTGLEGDISLYNTLALHNTQLLASYAAIDPRVKILCYVMKVFSKVCDIGDASRGSLSSYAYTLMVLFYLQQRNPPVIPVLQEIYDGERKPEVLVDGWNVYFFKDLENLHQRWPQYRKNRECVGELWLGLLRFYTEVFDFKEHVVCIRRKAFLTTFKKQWTSKYIVIEDPFDLNHNLGAGLSRKMTNFIMKALINGRRVFGTPVKHFPPEYTNKMEYFFDPDVLTEGQLAPNDRCCRICGKIGHFMKDCPMRKKMWQRREHGEEFLGGREEAELSRSPRDQMKEEKRRRKQERSCFLCGSQAHFKKECPLNKSPVGSSKQEFSAFTSSPSSNHLRIIREKEKQGSSQTEGKKQKPKVKRLVLGPQAGSLASKHMALNQSAQRGNPFD
ncbi:terminal uridylyltransferase 7 [Chanos chanos]|uniref:Terminal uridylyltransferase 7 n=1 Tax=Chanos chanos TaxID=29144 RepID=A0A6J2VHQ3_CHACN|nr:terminal uridylyltransferase 7 [Chanos chanos]XP_030632503.1 terminal uridylyltransferase 7 [Chanos chanos]